MKEHTAPPGVMIYRGSRELIAQLPPESVKALLLAMLDYDGTNGPDTEEPLLRLAWAAMRERLDHDRESYAQTCLTNKYSRFLREARRVLPRENVPDYETWYETSEQGSLSATKTLLRLSGGERA
ncbi:MAG: hypothetical protein IJL51_06885 [Oscillospiraceae bacterium]|nr:hypothetical protein [Oscillospiraceae bacterium]